MTPSKLKNGIHKDIDPDQYSAIKAVRHSHLRLMRYSPAHAHHADTTGGKTSDALNFGTAAHTAVLEPDAFTDRCIVAEFDSKRSKAAKEWWAAQESMGMTILKQEEWDACLRLRDRVWAHPIARNLLGGVGRNEITMLWEDADTGLRCKARVDRATKGYASPNGAEESSVLVDLKTTAGRLGDKYALEKVVLNYGYHTQAAMYLDGAQAIDPRPRKFVLIFVEKADPQGIVVYEMDESAIDLGRDCYRSWLHDWAECVDSGEWPSYAAMIQALGVPGYAYRGEAGYDD